MRKPLVLLIAIAATLFLVGCTKVEAAKIESASVAQRNLIQRALGNQYPVLETAAVRSSNHSRAYYVGAKFRVSGVGELVGIWLIGGNKSTPNLIFSVDGVAHQFSGMRKASKTKAYATINDPEAKVIRKYLKAR